MHSDPLQFTASMKIIGVNPYVLVSSPRAQKLRANWRKPMPVRIRINGMPKNAWRINMMPKGDGSFYLYLHESVRKASGTKVGDRVAVEIAFDEAYRNGPMHPMPPLFELGVKKSSAANASWNLLAPSRQKEVLRYFANLKSPEALERNILRMLGILAGENGRFMGRDWIDGK
ncbi:MAG TPA: DUF1905 domain-containing protein [Candidatus Kapabacteria bacterium]|jgi:hypothetical protein